MAKGIVISGNTFQGPADSPAALLARALEATAQACGHLAQHLPAAPLLQVDASTAAPPSPPRRRRGARRSTARRSAA